MKSPQEILAIRTRQQNEQFDRFVDLVSQTLEDEWQPGVVVTATWGAHLREDQFDRFVCQSRNEGWSVETAGGFYGWMPNTELPLLITDIASMPPKCSAESGNV